MSEGNHILVFYDLEWSHNEIIQIGAVCGEAKFSLCLRPSGRIDPFVRRKIKLDLRVGPNGERKVFDMTRHTFLHTVNPEEGLVQFLTWLEDQRKDQMKRLVMVSHGNADILVLDRNFSRFDLEDRLYRAVSSFVDFQEYLALHFKDISSGMGLKHLLGIFCKGQTYRLHCADEDSAALQQVFLNLHRLRGVLQADYLSNVASMRKILIRTITLPKSCKQIKELAFKLNPGSEYVLLPNIYGVFNIFASSPLFSKIERPEKFQFDVSGYVISHCRERYVVREESRERTKIELACYIGNAYFILSHLINANVKSSLNLVRKVDEGKGGVPRSILQPGKPVAVTVLVTSTNFVKVQEIMESRDKKPVNINKVLTDLYKLRPGEKLDPASVAGKWETEEEVKEDTDLDTNSNVTKAVSLLNFKGGKRFESSEVESDPVTLARRKKQLDYCKRTRDYQRYLERVPKTERSLEMPKTPNMNRKHSRRQWDGAVKHWKTQVHSEGRSSFDRNTQRGPQYEEGASEGDNEEKENRGGSSDLSDIVEK